MGEVKRTDFLKGLPNASGPPRNVKFMTTNQSGTEIVVNEGGEDIDFRIEGNTKNLITTNAGNDIVAIGDVIPGDQTNTLGETLIISGAAKLVVGNPIVFDNATGSRNSRILNTDGTDNSNIEFWVGDNAAPTVGMELTNQRHLFLSGSTDNTPATPTGLGGKLWVSAGELYYIGNGGTFTRLGVA